MKFNDYQQQAITTLNPALNYKQVLLNTASGIAGECGEVIDYLKKQLYHKMRTPKELMADPIVRQKLCDELGDVCWYTAVLAHRIGETLIIDRGIGADELEEEMLFLSEIAGLVSAAVHGCLYEARGADQVRMKLNDLLEEVGDLSSLFELTLDEIMHFNLEKLRQRHRSGFISTYSSDSVQ